jgi:hypothetical protein
MNCNIEDIRLYVECGFFHYKAHEDPYVAAAVVLLCAAYLETTDPVRLSSFTGYSHDFLAAVEFNMRNNDLWSETGYKNDSWFLDGVHDQRELFNHIAIACGHWWTDGANVHATTDPCSVYWEERGMEPDTFA